MNSTSRVREIGEDADEVARLLDRRPRRRADRHAHLVARSRRPASSCRVPAARAAARDRAPRRAAAPPRSRPAGSRGRDPGRCSRRAARGRRPASYCASSSTRAAVTRRSSSCASLAPASRSACFSVRSKPPSRRRLERRVDGFLGERPMIPQVHERREHDRRAAPALRGAASPAGAATARAAGDPSARARCARRSSCRRRESPSAARGRRARSRESARAARCPDSTASASFGPMPLTPISRSNSSCSSRVAKP